MTCPPASLPSLFFPGAGVRWYLPQVVNRGHAYWSVLFFQVPDQESCSQQVWSSRRLLGPCDFVTLLFHQAGEGFLSCVLVGVDQPHGLILAADRLGRPVVRKVQPPSNSLSPDVFPVAVIRSERSTVATGTIPSTVSRLKPVYHWFCHLL